MAKKITTLRAEPRVIQRIKSLGFIHDKPIGDVLEALVRIYDKVEADTVNNAFLNAGLISGWVEEQEEDPAEAFRRRAAKAKQKAEADGMLDPDGNFKE